MKHFTAKSFWQAYDALPSRLQRQADKQFERLKAAPFHPSLHLKKVGRYWSVRVNRNVRALAVPVEEGLLWFWIGTHREYEKLIGQSS